MASKAKKSSSSKATIKSFYKVAKGNKDLSMAVGGKIQAVAGAMPPSVDSLALGYPNEVSKEWHDKANQLYKDQDKCKPTISKPLVHADIQG
jgi:hypothetical protein